MSTDALLLTLAAWLGCSPTDDRLPRILAALPQTVQAYGDVMGTGQGFGRVDTLIEHGRVVEVTGHPSLRYKPPRAS